jgi:hypothetical protein
MIVEIAFGDFPERPQITAFKGFSKVVFHGILWVGDSFKEMY